MTTLHKKWAFYTQPLALAATIGLAGSVYGNPLRNYCEDGLTRSGGKTLMRDIAVFGIKSCEDLKTFDYSKLDKLDAKTKQDYDYAIEMLKTFHLINTMPKATIDQLVPLLPSPEDLATEQQRERDKCVELIKEQDKKKASVKPAEAAQPASKAATTLNTKSPNPYFASCLNITGQTIGVYGPSHAGSRLPNALYLLKSGYQTPKRWPCRGFYLPSDRLFAGKDKDRRGPMALERGDIVHDVIISHSNDYLVLSRPAIEKYFKPGASHWPIPSKSSHWLANR